MIAGWWWCFFSLNVSVQSFWLTQRSCIKIFYAVFIFFPLWHLSTILCYSNALLCATTFCMNWWSGAKKSDSLKKKKQQLADPHDKFRCRKNKQGTIDKFYFMQKLRETIEFYQEHFETMVNHVILTDFIK